MADVGLEVNIVYFVLALDVDAFLLEADVDVDSKDMGHLPPQDTPVARFVLYVDVHVDLILDVDLVLNVDLVVDFDVDCKDSGHFSPQDILGGRWSKPRGAISLDFRRMMSTGGCCPRNIVHCRAPTRQI